MSKSCPICGGLPGIYPKSLCPVCHVKQSMPSQPNQYEDKELVRQLEKYNWSGDRDFQLAVIAFRELITQKQLEARIDENERWKGIAKDSWDPNIQINTFNLRNEYLKTKQEGKG